MKHETITQPLLERVRQFCQNQWPYGKPDEQCDITSVFLIHLFGGVLQGGFNYEGGKEIPDGGGYRDGRGLWQLHYWVKLCGSVIDLTADQFHGGAPIVFEPDFHRYRSTFPDEHLKSVREHQGIKLAAWLRNWAAYTNPTRARQHRFLLVRDQYPEKLLPPGLTVSEVEAILKNAQRLHPDSWISWTRVEEDKGLRPTNHPSNTRGQKARVFEIDHEEGISTAYLCDPDRAIAMLFEFPAHAMVSGEDGDEIVVATTDKKFILVDETDDPYSSYDKRIPLADAIAAAPALNELAANLQKRGLPKVLPLVISLRKHVG